MILIGNDIIDINDNTNRKSFSNTNYLEKAFTNKELTKIKKDEKLKFVFWTCKEASYKVLMKTGFGKAFAPAFYETTILEKEEEKVWTKIIYQDIQIFCCSYLNKNYAYSYAVNKEGLLSENIITKKKFKDKIQRDNFILSLLNEKSNDKFDCIAYDHNNIPMLYSGEKKCDMSLSHDGNYTALSYLKSVGNE